MHAEYELFATGENSFGQTSLDTADPTSREPRDLDTFQGVLKRDQPVSVRPFSTYTTVESGRATFAAGYVPRSHAFLRSRDAQTYGGLVEAEHGVVAVHYQGSNTIHLFPTMTELAQALPVDRSSTNTVSLPSNVAQLVAWETGFVALTEGGQVYTWGDERYAMCLGRDCTPQSPADAPGLVQDLEDLPTGRIRKIAAAGFTLAALTTGNDLYCWGGCERPGMAVSGISPVPSPLNLDATGEVDVVDVAVGQGHMVALATTGVVYCIGSNSHGQLGLGEGRCASSTEWLPVDLPIRIDQRVIAVAAGPNNSWVVAKTL